VKTTLVGRQKTIGAGEAGALQCVHLLPKRARPYRLQLLVICRLW